MRSAGTSAGCGTGHHAGWCASSAGAWAAWGSTPAGAWRSGPGSRAGWASPLPPSPTSHPRARGREAGRGGCGGSAQGQAPLATELGARRGQALLQDVLGAGLASGVTAAWALAEAGVADGQLATDPEPAPDTGACGDIVDMVVDRARAARAAEPPEWP